MKHSCEPSLSYSLSLIQLPTQRKCHRPVLWCKPHSCSFQMVKNGKGKWKINCDHSQRRSEWIGVEYVRNVLVSMVTLEAWLLSNAKDDVSGFVGGNIVHLCLMQSHTYGCIHIDASARMDYCPAWARGTSLFVDPLLSPHILFLPERTLYYFVTVTLVTCIKLLIYIICVHLWLKTI